MAHAHTLRSLAGAAGFDSLRELALAAGVHEQSLYQGSIGRVLGPETRRRLCQELGVTDRILLDAIEEGGRRSRGRSELNPRTPRRRA